MKNFPLIKKINSCRVCKANDFTKVLTFGPTPLANAFLSKEKIDGEEYFYPLDIYFCNNCNFLTLGHVVSPVELFKDYVYVSSTSKVFINHFKTFSKQIYKRFKLTEGSLVLDIGSNDGILLRPFKDLGTKVLGIEPASKIAKLARKEGVETISQFFSAQLAKKIVGQYGIVKIATATNVFAHIDDLDEVIRGLDILLDKDGIFIMEAPHLVDFLEKRYFDLVYHEHLSYWAVSPLVKLFKRFNMTIFDVQKVDSHGGSIRVFIKKNEGNFKIEKSVSEFVESERKKGLNKVDTYIDFGKRVLQNKMELVTLLTKIKLSNKKIIGYGAPAKGNTLLNYFKIGNEVLDYIIDDSPLKQGLYTPGTHIPVVSPKILDKYKPDYILILAWNFAQSIMVKYQSFRENGGKFIIPVPIPKIVS